MIYNLPLRLTTLHFAQRLRMEGLTFMIAFSLHMVVQPNIELYLYYSIPSSFNNVFAVWSRDSQDKRFSFGDSHRVFLVCRQ